MVTVGQRDFKHPASLPTGHLLNLQRAEAFSKAKLKPSENVEQFGEESRCREKQIHGEEVPRGGADDATGPPLSTGGPEAG